MTSHPSMVGDLLQLCAKEAKRRLLTLATLFSLGALAALAVVLITPKTWEATAVIIAEGNNIIKPLMEGRAVPTTIADQTANVTQVVMSRRIVRELAQYAGLFRGSKLSPQDEERVLHQFRSRIRIEPQRELIRVSYRDADPRRTYLVANKVAETFVREGVQSKARESREAFEFINKQVTEYSQKLGLVHEQLLAYYRGDAPKDAPKKPAGGAETANPDQAAPTDTRAKISADQLAALRLEQATLEAQLERRPAAAAARDDSRQLEDQARTRMTQAQNELDRLLSTYTDQHPDVKRAQRSLEIAKEDLKRAEHGRADRDTARAAASALDDEVTRAARGRLDEVRRQITAATGVPFRRRTPMPRAAAAGTLSPDLVVPEMRGVGQDTKLSELSRRYEATRDVYQDLLKRRENARVSMELDVEHQGFTLRIQEAAELPMTASGLRMLHQTAIGFVLALLLPIGFLLAVVRFDPRVRSVGQIERLANVPLLVAIPYAAPGGEPRERTRRRMAVAMVVGVLVVYILVFIIRAKAAG